MKKLAKLCVRVEDVFGSPQDIEWTADIEVCIFYFLCVYVVTIIKIRFFFTIYSIVYISTESNLPPPVETDYVRIRLE